MRYQVPQFVDIQDKIIGPFTLKQFLMYVAAVLVLIPVFLFSDLSLFITIALPVLGIAAAFAHLKINGQSLATVLGNAIRFYTNSNLFLWRRTGELKTLTIRDQQWEQLIEHPPQASHAPSSLSSIARSLETDGNVVESEDVEDPFDEDAARSATTPDSETQAPVPDAN